MRTSKLKKVSAPYIFSFLSLPFVLIYFADHHWSFPFFAGNHSSKLSHLVRDLIFFNNVHVCFSFFLLYKVKNFQRIVSVPKAALTVVLVAATSSFLFYESLNNEVIRVFGGLHAFLQSLGIFLLYFCAKEHRKKIKMISYLTMIFITIRTLKPEYFSENFYFILGLTLFFFFSAVSRSFLGILFSFRFFLWFSSSPTYLFALGSLHGLEYFMIVYLMAKNGELIKFKAKDILVLSPFLAFFLYYPLSTYWGLRTPAMTFIHYILFFSHVVFDTYSYRFKFKTSRENILPLFQQST